MSEEFNVEEIDAEIEKLQEKRKEALKAQKSEDLKTVKELCKRHGFTKTQLRGYIKERGDNKEKK